MRLIRCFILSLLVLVISASYLSAGDKYSGSTAARAEFDKAAAAKRANEWDKAVAGYRKAIELDPNFAEAHQKYIDSFLVAEAYKLMQSKDPKAFEEHGKDGFNTIIKEYEDLVRQHPKSPVYLWILGTTSIYSDPEKKEKNCKKAVEIDPAFGPGYGCIAEVAELRGDTKGAAAYLRKALGYSPDNKDLWRKLQWTLARDPKQLAETTTNIVQKFPNDDIAVEALYTQAETLPEAERISQLEEIVAKYPVKKFHFTSMAANFLFSLYDRTAPEKAAGFAHKIANEMPDDKSWKSNVAYADSMAAAEAKIAANDGTAALAVLKDVTPGPFLSPVRMQLLKAKAQDLSGNIGTAYADLLKIFAEQPVPRMRPVLYEYGKKLNKGQTDVDNEIWNLRTAKAKPAIPFSLESFIDGKKISLDDYKGKVVLLDFWYPSCGPCLRAMPYMEDLYTKYKDSGLVFLGVNGMEGEEGLVASLVKARGWSFIPLKGTEKWAKEAYNVQGYPSTFLIGRDGKVYFRPHTYDQEQHDIAELQIQALLAASEQSTKTTQPK